MRVSSEPIDADVEIEALRAEEGCPEGGIYEGELVGFHCQHCDAVDETLRQIIHEDDCPLAGEHGRALYSDDLPKLEAELESPELGPDHPVTAYYAGFSGAVGNAKNGHILAFRCDECGNSDETLFEIVHDDLCSLAGRHGRAAAKKATPVDSHGI